MLRVGLTGGLGSGKSTVGTMLARRGAYVLEADEIGRELMQPGQAVYRAIVERFGAGVVKTDGTLDRAELARLAFTEGRVEELNVIVHPAVIARQAEIAGEIGARDGGAVVVVESALIFETKHREPEFGKMGREVGREWRERFDRLVLVTAEEETKVRRFVARGAGGGTLDAAAREELAAEARRRLARQMPDAQKAAMCEDVLRNDGDVDELQMQVDALWGRLREIAGSAEEAVKP